MKRLKEISDAQRVLAVLRSSLRAACVRVSLSVFAPVVCLMLSLALPVAAQSRQAGRVSDAILGVRIGSTLEEARARLRPLGKLGGEAEHGERSERGEKGESEAREEAERELEERREGGRKETWVLKKSPYAYLVYKADQSGRVVWVTAFARRGKGIPFAELGDLALSTSRSTSQAIWNVQRPQGGYRLVAKGPDGKANVIHLISLTMAREL